MSVVHILQGILNTTRLSMQYENLSICILMFPLFMQLIDFIRFLPYSPQVIEVYLMNNCTFWDLAAFLFWKCNYHLQGDCGSRIMQYIVFIWVEMLVCPIGKGYHPVYKSCSGSKDQSLSGTHGFPVLISNWYVGTLLQIYPLLQLSVCIGVAIVTATPIKTDSCDSGYICRRVSHVYVTQQDAPHRDKIQIDRLI
jgi:hypothetical protein